MEQTSNSIDFSFTQAQVDEVLIKRRGVYLYGAGEALQETIEFLRGQDIPIYGILDRKSALWGSQREGVDVFPPEHLTDLNTPIIICARLCYDEIFASLKERGFTCVLPFYFHKTEEIVSSEEYRKALAARHIEIKTQLDAMGVREPLILKSIDVVLTERCSLRCKDCSNLMQYYAKPKHEDLAEQVHALDEIAGAVDFIQELRVLGGEPFVSPDFSTYITHMLQYKNVGTIVVYTNGTILPKGDALECLKSPRVFVRISDYGRVSRNVGRLKELLSEQHILYEVVIFSRWLDCSGFEDRKRSEAELKKTFLQCCTNTFYTLKDGKLYGCPFIANAAALEAIPSSAYQEAIDTHDKRTDLRSAIQNFTRLPYFEGCRYCAGRPDMVTNIPAAIQTASPIPYQQVE